MSDLFLKNKDVMNVKNRLNLIKKNEEKHDHILQI